MCSVDSAGLEPQRFDPLEADLLTPTPPVMLAAWEAGCSVGGHGERHPWTKAETVSAGLARAHLRPHKSKNSRDPGVTVECRVPSAAESNRSGRPLLPTLCRVPDETEQLGRICARCLPHAVAPDPGGTRSGHRRIEARLGGEAEAIHSDFGRWTVYREGSCAWQLLLKNCTYSEVDHMEGRVGKPSRPLSPRFYAQGDFDVGRLGRAMITFGSVGSHSKSSRG